MAVRSLRNVEKQKKKARRAAPRKKNTRNQGNTLAVRRRLKKLRPRPRRQEGLSRPIAARGYPEATRRQLYEVSLRH